MAEKKDYTVGIREHWDNLPIKKIEIPEWGFDGNKAIFVRPYNILERNKMRNNDNPILSAIDVIVAKCENKDGNKMFDVEDKEFFKRKAQADMVIDLANQILIPPTIEDIKKK
jgi:hypothetical protein|tara:strand:+ start:510 stop:848 length:339 start_codon:yes stop_codon:yes gene_type:complete